MTLPRLPFPASPLTVWAVEPTVAQLAWGELPAGPVTVTATHSGTTVAVVTCEHPGGPGTVDIGPLPPGADHRLVVESGAGRSTFTVITPAPPPGPELFRFATISDLHLGSDHFGFLKQMKDISDDPVPFAIRSARAAIDEATAWGARHLIIKGDAAHHATHRDFAAVGELVDRSPNLPMSLLPGNHDTDQVECPLPVSVGRRRLIYERSVSSIDLPGIRVVLGDTTIPGRGIGTLDRIGDDLVDAAAAADRGVFIAVHQQLQQRDPVRYWPPGVARREASPFLDRLADVRADAVISSGHTHRNRARTHDGVLVSEVASTHHWPGVWAGYAVHEGGIRQVVRRIGSPTVIDWHEYSKNATLSVWERYAPGRLRDRCVTPGLEHIPPLITDRARPTPRPGGGCPHAVATPDGRNRDG